MIVDVVWMIGSRIPAVKRLMSIPTKTSTLVSRCRHRDHLCTCNNTHTLPFYGSLSGTTRVGRYQKRHSPTHTWNVLWEPVIILDFMRCGEDNWGKSGWTPPHLDHRCPHLHHPPILCRMPFLSQPSQFILAWDTPIPGLPTFDSRGPR